MEQGRLIVRNATKGMSAAGGLSLALLMTSTALSQTAAPPAEPDRAAAQLEEIIVTADRKNSYSADLVQAGSFRGARQLDTPLTVAVIPQEVLNSQQAQGLLDALRNTAGVTSSQTSPTVYNNLAIRGINVENRGNYRLNGSLPIINLVDLPLEDKDRVEALKGASALYYGFTTPSGVINLTMKRPTPQPYLATTVTYNNHGALGGAIDAGGTAGMFGARINAVLASVDTGIDVTRGKRSLLSGAFDFKPTDDLTFSLDAERIYKNVGEPGVYRFVQPASTAANPFPAITLPRLLDASTNFAPDWAYNRSAATNVLAHAAWKINDAWALTVDAGTSKVNRDRRFTSFRPDNIVTGEGRINVGLQKASFKNENVRAELAGTFYTGPLLHEVLIGSSKNVRDQFNPTSININCLGTVPTGTVAQFPTTCAYNIYSPRVIPETPLQIVSAPINRIEDIGYYAFDRIKVGEWLSLLAGIRRSDYTESNHTTGAVTFQDKPTSYSVGAVVKPKSWVSLYATYIEGLETTPGAPTTAVNAGAQLPATSSKQKEGGIKIEPKKGLLFQAAYFDIERGSTYVNGANVYVQDGRARYKGAELSLTGEVTSDLSLYGSALFLDATQSEAAPATTSSAGVYSPTVQGKRIENTPKRTFSLAGEYRLGQWVKGLSVTAGAYYTGNRAINPLNQAFIPSYTLYDLGVAYRTDVLEHPTTIRLNAQNIFNKKYWASTGGLLLSQGAPGVVKLSISTEF
jgi:iron complex outermembrane receptor protein